MEKIYTIPDLCSYLGVSHVTVRKHIIKGELRASKLGRAYKVTESAVQEFVKAQEQKLSKTMEQPINNSTPE